MLEFKAEGSCLVFQLVERGEEIERVIHDEQAISGQVINRAGRLVIDIGQIPLNAVEAVSLRQVLHLDAHLLAVR